MYADDTNIPSLLLHHYYNTPNLKDIFLTEMTRESDHQQSKYYSIREVFSQLLKRGEPMFPHLLFAHAFTGSDSTSAIYQFGKTSIFKKLRNSKWVRNIADIYQNGQNHTCHISHFLRLVGRNSNLYHHKSEVWPNKYEFFLSLLSSLALLLD